MDSKSISSRLNTHPNKTSLVLSVLLEIVLAFLFFISACISLLSSMMIGMFHLRTPCFCAKPHGGVSWNVWKQENSCNLICDYHADKLFLLKKLILKRGCAPVHSLCEDCMLLKCASTDMDNYVINNRDCRRSTSKCFSSDILMHVDYCQICSLKRHICCLPFSLNKESMEEGLTDSPVEVESESESSDSFIRDTSERPKLYMHSFCLCCKETIRHTSSRTVIVKEKFAKVFVEDFDEQDSSNKMLQENLLVAFSEREKHKISQEGYGKIHFNEKKAQELLMVKDGSNVDCVSTLKDSKSFQKTRIDGEVLPQSCHLEGKHCTVTLSEEGEKLQHSVSMIKELKHVLEAERESYSALYAELEAERNASAIAANETMAMISRLQEEKAAIQMEATQFKRMVQEKAAFDQEAIALLKDILCKREEEKFALEKEVELYRSRLFNHRITEWRQKRAESDEVSDLQRGLLAEWKGKHGRIDENIEEKRKLQGLFEKNRSSGSFDYAYDKNYSLTERVNMMRRLRESKMWETKNEVGFQFRKRSDDWPPCRGGNLQASFDAIRIDKRKNDETYSEIDFQETSSSLDATSCQQTLAVISPELLNIEGLLIKQSTMVEDEGEPKAVAHDVEEHVTDPWHPACITELQQIEKVGAENVDKLEWLSQDSSRSNYYEKDNNNMHSPYSYWEGQGRGEHANNIFDIEGITEMMRTTPLSCVQRDVGDELPFGLNTSETLHAGYLEEIDSGHIATFISSELSLSQAGKQAREGESDDLKSYKICPHILDFSKEHYSFCSSSQDVKGELKASDNELQVEFFQGVGNS